MLYLGQQLAEADTTTLGNIVQVFTGIYGHDDVLLETGTVACRTDNDILRTLNLVVLDISLDKFHKRLAITLGFAHTNSDTA